MFYQGCPEEAPIPISITCPMTTLRRKSSVTMCALAYFVNVYRHFHTAVTNSTKPQKYKENKSKMCYITNQRSHSKSVEEENKIPPLRAPSAHRAFAPLYFLTFLTYFLLKMKWLILEG